MKRMTAGDLQALELLMQTTPGFEHFDSGADGILPECRSCRFHRPFWKYQSCVFAECPYCCNPVSTLKIKVAHLLPERKSIMDNKIEVFKNEQFGEIRTALIENEPWFVAVDVCRALEIGNSSQAISRLDADEKMITLISNEGNKRGNPNMTVVNEPGLYTLILSSRKPEAKAFKRWITHDVIPMIRKTGGYMTDSLLERIQKEPAVIVEFAQALILEKNRVKALECELNTAKPKADYYDAFINPDDCTNIRTTAKELKISERKFVQFLLKEKYLFRSPSGQLLPYNKDSNAGLFIVRDFVTYCYTGSQTYFTPKGKDVIRLKFQKKCGKELLPKIAR